MKLDELEALAREATPGEWILATSNSWRRFVTRDRMMPVCEPVTQNDGHPDLHFRNGGADGPDAAYIAAANPQAILKLCAVVRAAKAVGYSNGFDAAYPDKLEALRTALSDIGAKE